MDDLKLYSQSEKGLDSLVQTVCVFSEDIVMEFGIHSNGVWYIKVCYVSNGERKDCEVNWYRVVKW